MTDDVEPALNVDIDSLTFEEVEAVEDELGMGFDEIIDRMNGAPGPKTKITRVMAWMMIRRVDPSVTLDDLKVKPMVEVLEMVPDPKAPTGSETPESDGQ